MILRIFNLWKNRHINRGFAQLEAHTRASTKLTPGYTKRETRRLKHCRELFESNVAGSRKGLG